MEITHADAVGLVCTVRAVYPSERGTFGGLIHADVIEKSPFLAAVLALAPFYHHFPNELIDKFMMRWKAVFEYPEEYQEYRFVTYKNELSLLIKSLASTGEASAPLSECPPQSEKETRLQ
jgi:hypothetical protein